MQITVGNRVIREPTESILRQIRSETGFRLYNRIIDKGDNLIVTCPFHKGGNEAHPSCSVLNTDDDPNVPRGWHHCFTCGISMPIEKVISTCFNKDDDFGQIWLKEHYGDTYLDTTEFLPEIDLNAKSKEKHFLDKSILNSFRYYHPYMWERKLTQEVVDKFDVGYDPQRQMLTFPVYDMKDNLVMITGRSVKTKLFHIDKDVEKPVYLLNYVAKNKFPVVLITEAQIDALTAWSYGFPCVATIGSISKNQMDIINHCGIRTFVTLFDNDSAGQRFTELFNKYIRNDIFTYNIKIDVPGAKDINDLSKEQFIDLLRRNGIQGKLNSSLNGIEF